MFNSHITPCTVVITSCWFATSCQRHPHLWNESIEVWPCSTSLYVIAVQDCFCLNHGTGSFYHFADDILWNENDNTFLKISLKMILKGPIDKCSSLIQVPNKRQSSTWTNDDHDHWRHIVSASLSWEIIFSYTWWSLYTATWYRCLYLVSITERKWWCTHWSNWLLKLHEHICTTRKVRLPTTRVPSYWHGLTLTLCCKFFKQKHKRVFTISTIPPHWHDRGSWNPSSCKTMTCLFDTANITAADDLVMQGVRASSALILT